MLMSLFGHQCEMKRGVFSRLTKLTRSPQPARPDSAGEGAGTQGSAATQVCYKHAYYILLKLFTPSSLAYYILLKLFLYLTFAKVGCHVRLKCNGTSN